MCGIFGVSGAQAPSRVVAGLKRLEYRGYDSWGVVAVLPSSSLEVEKHVGKISQVEGLGLPDTQLAVGHTRWATHGGVTQQNAHPHLATTGRFAVVHNGIVQNFAQLKAELTEAGYQFVSETDTEVIVGLIERQQLEDPEASLAEVVRQVFKMLEGRNTIAVVSAAGELVAVRQGSPLVVGRGKRADELFVSSDTLSFADQVDQIALIDNGQQILIQNGQIKLFSVAQGAEVKLVWQPLDVTAQVIDLEGYPDFMSKEIHESAAVVARVIDQPEAELQHLAQKIKQSRQVYTIGSGTAGVAAAQLAYYLRAWGNVSATSLVGADAVEYLGLIGPSDLVIAPSQSGETADVLEILELLKLKQVPIATYVNMPGATMTRLADFPFLAQAGPEVCVMSTKILVSQMAWGYLVAKTVAGQMASAKQFLTQLQQVFSELLNDETWLQQVADVADYLADQSDIFLMAKGQNFQTIREGMIKIIEGSYRHAHAISAGDLKHYAITLMESGVPVVAVMSQDSALSDVLNAAHEVKTRGASLVGIGPKTESGFEHFIEVPDVGEVSAIANVLPLQLMAYHMAKKLGHDVDHPRNIAKSVTVK